MTSNYFAIKNNARVRAYLALRDSLAIGFDDDETSEARDLLAADLTDDFGTDFLASLPDPEEHQRQRATQKLDHVGEEDGGETALGVAHGLHSTRKWCASWCAS